MSDAERQAHTAGEFDEAAAMRRAKGQAGEDLEADLILMVDAWLKVLPERDRGSLLWVGRDEVLALHAALERFTQLENVITCMDREVEGHIELVVETQRSRDVALVRQRKLRDALEEYGRHKDGCPGAFPLLDLHCNCGLEALLARSVAEKGSSWLERAIVRRDEVIDIAKLHSVCWFSLINGQPHDVPRCGSCGGCMLFAALVEFDEQEALLAQPAAGEERERAKG